MAVCWACGGTRTVPSKAKNLPGPIAPEDLRITDARYGTTLALARCIDCGFLFADDPDLSRLDALYAALDDPAYEASDEGRALQMKWLLDLCLEAQPDARTLLDVGAATGLLLSEARKRNLDAIGVEPSRKLARTGQERGATILVGTLPLEELGGRIFDLVTLIDVVEHVSDPVALCRAARERLAPGGVLVVVTPDVRSVAAQLLGPKWWHFRVAHVGYFSPRSFGRAAERAGLRVIAHRRARWFFAVGYLTERVERYLPVEPLTRRFRQTALGRRLERVIIPLHLGDSSVYLLQASVSPAAPA